MSFTVENTSGSALDINDLGITLDTGEITDLALRTNPETVAISANGGDLDVVISAADLTVKDPLDGVTNLSVADGLAVARSHNEPHWRVGAGARIGDISDVDVSGASTGDVITLDGSGDWVDTDPATLPANQNVWETISADSGSTTANTTTDTLTVAGGTNITTAIVGDTLTINAVGGGDPDQNLWETISSDSGSTSADTTTDTLTVAGGTSISTAIAGDTLTITNDDPNVDQNLFETVTADSGSTTADTTTDTLTVAGGTNITTAISGDTLTINSSGTPDQNLWETMSSDAGSVAANTTTDTFTIAGGTGISTAIAGDTLTITNDSPNVDQNLFETVTGDAGSTTADTTTDTITIAGGTGISTAVAGDTLTITNDSPNVDQNLFETVTADSGSTTANTTTDTLTIAGGVGITTAISGDTLTITASGGGVNSFETIVTPAGGPVVADSSTDTLTLTQSAGIAITGTAGTDTINIGPADDLAAIEALATTGFPARTAANTWALRTLTQPAAGITITNSGGVAGNPTFALANDLAALEGLATTGIASRTAADTWAVRTLVAPAAGITITNAGGVAGNPTFALANDLLALENLATNGMSARTGTSTWATRTITGTTNQITMTNGDGVAGNPTIAIATNPVLPGTASVTVPAGATGARPGSPVAGMLRFNSTNSLMEFYDGTQWVTFTANLVGSPLAYHFLVGGKPGNGTYLGTTTNHIGSDEAPYVIPYAATLVGIAYSNKNDDTSPVINVMRATFTGGTADASIASWTPSTCRVAYKTDFSVAIAAGDKIAVHMAKGADTEPDRPVVSVYLRITAAVAVASQTEDYSGNFSF